MFRLAYVGYSPKVLQNGLPWRLLSVGLALVTLVWLVILYG